MSEYRRYYVPGGTYFFTVVTYQRRPILIDTPARACLREALASVRDRWPFTIVAMVLLPNHLHAVWTLPFSDANYSTRWRLIKERFTRHFLDHVGAAEGPTPSPSRSRRQEQNVWQRRFWEHVCRDEDDLKRCVDYVHWNPKKHGFVRQVGQWRWSTFHRYVRRGEYDSDWGGSDPAPGFNMPDI
jgi:putative transposase